MIHVSKRSIPPAILRNRGASTTEQLKQTYTANPPAYDSGDRAFKFDNSLYGAKSVKNALITDQHKKCCFCESKITHISYGDVEHYRPKGGWKQSADDTLSQPGYYWLAYGWENLFLSCQICNQRHKGNLFPLESTGQRAQNHQDDIELEQPLFVSPAEDPEQHIRFYADEAVGLTERGAETISSLGLNRDALGEQRREALQKVRLIKNIVDVLSQRLASPRSEEPSLTVEEEQLLTQARGMLDRIRQNDAEYAAMFRAFLN